MQVFNGFIFIKIKRRRRRRERCFEFEVVWGGEREREIYF
jgi:hypothetical protein